MLKKSKVNDLPPFLGKAGAGPRPINKRPNSPGSSGNRVLLDDVPGIRGGGGDSKGSTFKAPRKDSGGSPMTDGFTKLGKI